MESVLSGQGGSYASLLIAVSLSFVFLYVVYGAIWRIYYSPIAHIPGPRLAALTFWNEVYMENRRIPQNLRWVGNPKILLASRI